MVEVGKIGGETLVLDGRYISIFRAGKLVWKRAYRGYILPDGNLYSYRRRVRITELSGKTLTDYQVKIEIGARDPIFAHARSAGEDIRFCYYPEERMLSYWIEKFDPVAEEAIIWVKVPEIPANSEIEIYMYYGNPDVPSASSGDDTFIFFDDFEGDLSKWTVIKGTDFSIENGVLKVWQSTTDEPKDTIRSNKLIGKEAIVEYDVKPSSDTDIACAIWITGAANEPFWIVLHRGANIYYWDGSSWTKKASGTSYRNANQWNREKVIFTAAGEIKAYTNDNLAVSLTGQTPIEGYVGIRLGVDSVDYIDNYRVRKYAETEPSVTVGAEE